MMTYNQIDFTQENNTVSNKPIITNMITVDVEDWYQSSLDILGQEYAEVARPVIPSERVVINTHRLLNIFNDYDVKATFFILGSVTETYPDLVKEIQNSGHEIATHGYGHELVYQLTPKQFETDLQRSIELLSSITNKKVTGYRAPYFSITDRSEFALKIISECGLRYDSSIFPIRRRLYGFPGRNGYPHQLDFSKADGLIEIPISTFNFFNQKFPIGGGGYFRIFPYSIVQKVFRQINGIGQPVVFYLHPYELDVDELKSPLPDESIKTKFIRHTQNFKRNSVEKRLKRLLKDFKWTSINNWVNNNLKNNKIINKST